MTKLRFEFLLKYVITKSLEGCCYLERYNERVKMRKEIRGTLLEGFFFFAIDVKDDGKPQAILLSVVDAKN